MIGGFSSDVVNMPLCLARNLKTFLVEHKTVSLPKFSTVSSEQTATKFAFASSEDLTI